MSDTGGLWLGGWTFSASTQTSYVAADNATIYVCDVTAGGFTVDAPSPAELNSSFGVLLVGSDSGNTLTINGGAVTVNPITEPAATSVAIVDGGEQVLLLFAYDGSEWRLYDGIVSRQSNDPEITTNDTIGGYDNFFEVDASSGDIAVTLPATGVNRRQYTFKRTDTSANAVTIDGNGNTIDGESSQILMSYDCLAIRYSPNALEWSVI